ncbi:hypothetical protein TrST_g1045 [Triparma strigata]|uniref:EFHB C-terminal EF-hand domain-containing protein n=1 Tax=Triparma strigata TaxID=1606541 RepID=A0A9W6ZWP2_9STRA|nr:hypothetical protein TrST_g1045 [Triparma strigata]|mmetsp:Transcript_8153/g.14781  ORF Transcript_8153/g.14781 Transcript_8153/m.14781 type:complete len:420 (+) Transcript_8153:71-1330(+)
MSSLLPPKAGAINENLKLESAQMCVNPHAAEPPATPPHVRKWRKSNFVEPGKRVIHPGMQDDFAAGVDPNKIFGTGTASESDHVADVWKNPEGDTEFQKAKNQLMEAVYKSVKREPLGTSYNRGHKMPSFMKDDPKFRHGIKSVKGQTAKEVLNPADETEEDVEATKLYIKSHGSYGPGVQKTRNYNWKVDPHATVWGDKGKDIALGGLSQAVSDILHGVGDEPKKTITSKKYDDFQSMTDLLGRARNLGHGLSLPDKDHVFGKGSVRRGPNEWDSRDCIEGKYDISEQAPDADLGTTMTPGFRNCTTEVRRFGCPSVRSDIPKYARRSVADNQNYGDDVNARYLLHPSQFASLGVEDEEFVNGRDKEYIKTMFNDTGYGVADDVFEEIYASACEPDGSCGVDQYRKAYNNWLFATGGI